MPLPKRPPTRYMLHGSKKLFLSRRSRTAQHKKAASHPGAGTQANLQFVDFPFAGRKALPDRITIEKKEILFEGKDYEEPVTKTRMYVKRKSIHPTDLKRAEELLAELNLLLKRAANREHAFRVSIRESQPHWGKLQRRLRTVDSALKRSEKEKPTKLKVGALKKEKARLLKNLAKRQIELQALFEHNNAMTRARRTEAILLGRFYR